MKTVFVLYTCDEWQSRSSMRVASILTSIEKLRNAVRYLVSKDIMSIVSEGALQGSWTAAGISMQLTYGYAEEIDLDMVDEFHVTGE